MAQYLDLDGLKELVKQIKALDTATREYAGTLPEGATQTNILDYVLNQISESEFSGEAKDVTVADSAGHFKAETKTVEAILAEIATEIEKIEGNDTTDGSFAKAIKTAIGELKIGDTTYSTVKSYVDALNTAVLTLVGAKEGKLDDLKTTVKTNLVAAINEIKDDLDDVDYSGKADKVENATAGNLASLDENGNLADSGKKVATSDIVEESTDEGLVSAKQVAKFVKSEVADISGAMHFVGVATPTGEQTDVQAITALYPEGKSPVAGDFAIISTNGLEYVYSGTAWVKLGDEQTYVTKSTSIAGVNFENGNITKEQLLTGLEISTIAVADVTKLFTETEETP